MLRALGGQQQATARRALALQTLQGLIEQVGNMPWDKLTPEEVQQTELPAAVKPFLQGAKLAVALREEPGPVAAKRVTMELSWNGSKGQPAGPVRLTTWVFPENEWSR
jgi:hypothetical protein